MIEYFKNKFVFLHHTYCDSFHNLFFMFFFFKKILNLMRRYFFRNSSLQSINIKNEFDLENRDFNP